MAVVENVERIYPTRSELEKESQTNVPCPVVGCCKIFPQPSALRFHLVKLHRLIVNESDARLAQHLRPQPGKQYEYYCPEPSCKFSGHEQKFFQSYKKLKQHFMRLHAQRTQACSICGEKFGLGYDLTPHAVRCRRKPWCATCKLCMGSFDSLTQHLSETGHEGLRDQCSEDVNNAETPDQRVDETRGTTSAKECSDSCGVGQALTVSQTMHDGSRDIETGIMKTEEQTVTVKASVEITKEEDIVPSRELIEILLSGMPSDVPSSSETRNEDTADQSNRKTVISKSKDVRLLSRKKRSCLIKSEQDTTARTMLPASSFIVIPAPVGTVFFYTVPYHPVKSELKRLAPCQSSTHLELDPPGTSRFLPVAGEWLVADECTLDMSTCDLKSLKTDRESVSASTQTRSRRIKVAETQTTEGYTLKKALGFYNSPLPRQSCGSQVSPRARVKRLNVQSTHTQTSRTLARKNKRSASMQTTQETFASVVPSMPSSNVWPDFVHNETQTIALLQQLQESLAESSSTQTLESYLLENFANENCVGTSSNETCGTVDMLRDSVYATITAESGDLYSSVAMPIAQEPAKPGMTGENISGMNEESDYSLFSSEYPNIVEGEQNRSGFLIHDEMFVNDFDSNAALTAASDDLMTQQQKTFTAETQTMHPDCLTDFLTAASQTNDFDVDLMSINTETQTVDDDFFTQFWSHMETQTTDEFLTEFGFSDTETQTTWVFGENVRPLDVAPGIPPQEPQSTVLLDMETQTCFQ